MKTHTPHWTATSTKWKEASRTPRKPVLLGLVSALIITTSAIGLKAQASSATPGLLAPGLTHMPAHAPTTRAAKTSIRETVSMLIDLARKASHKSIS